ncbi:hypothetical protein ABBQ32_009610 [Trebouxia sp. C0010 RCD-2024]
MKENAALKRQNHGTKLIADSAAQQQPAQQNGIGDIIRQEQPFTSHKRQENQASSVRTFADITTKTANTPAQDPQIDSSSRIEQLFSSGFSLHAEEASHHFNRATSAALHEHHRAADTQPALPSSTNPPLDWSIKTAVRFSSAKPFAIAEEALTVSGSTEPLLTQQLSIFLLTEQERYQAASMSWQHPETSYLPTTLSALQAAKSSPDDLIAQRHAAWQQAFRGLYYAMRHRKCDAFYLATPQGVHPHKQNMVFFGAPGIAGRPSLHAIVSRSTLGLRTAMQQQYHLTFTMPLAPTPKKKQQEDEPQLPDDLAVLQTRGGVTGREGDNSRESLLYFEGHLEVQGLFEYLFNERRKLCGEECDVPLLMAPVPFPAACLKQLHLKVLGASESARGKTMQHKLEMKGSIPPWVLDRLTGVFKDAHPVKFQASLCLIKAQILQDAILVRPKEALQFESITIHDWGLHAAGAQ